MSKYKSVFDAFMSAETKKVPLDKLSEMVVKAGFEADSQKIKEITEEHKYMPQLLLEDLSKILNRFEKKHNNSVELIATIKDLFIQEGNKFNKA